MMNDGEPTLSHISSAIRTKHTVSTGNTAVDLEISAIKLESPFAQPSNEEGGNVKVNARRSLTGRKGQLTEV